MPAMRPMLAYIFWHWPPAHTDQVHYELLLTDFHRVLARRALAGFIGSVVYRMERPPWASGGAVAYEDRYLCATSAALDAINEAAVAGECQPAHDRIAAAAAGGLGGLYRRRAGALAPTHVHWAQWLGKPAGMSYGEFHAVLDPCIAAGQGMLWRRQMVLGPAPEFCIHAASPVALPPALLANAMRLRCVYDGCAAPAADEREATI